MSPVGGPCVESRRKADDMLMMCTLKEMSGDLHEALIFCNQAACTYLFIFAFLLLILDKCEFLKITFLVVVIYE